MVLKLLKPMLDTTVVSNRSNSRTIWSPSSKRKILKLKVNWSNNRIFMKPLDLTEIFTRRISWKPKRRLQSLEWSSEEWPKTSPNWKKRSLPKINRSFKKKIGRSSTRRRMNNSRKIRRRLRGILRVPKKWSRRKKVILLGSSTSSVKLSLRSRNRRRIMKWLLMREIS